MRGPKLIYILKIGFLAGLFFIVRFILKFDGLYGQDAYEYLRYTDEMHSFFINGTLLRDYFWGLGYPFLGSVFKLFFHNTSLALQLVSLVAALVTWICIDKIIELIYKEKPNYLVGFLFFALSPIAVLQSIFVMSDMLALAFIMLSMYHLLKFSIHSSISSFVLGVVATMFAFHTRYVSLVVLLPFYILVLGKIIKNKEYKLLPLSIAIVLVILLPHFLLHPTTNLKFISHQFLINWNPIHLFQRSFSTIDGQSNHTFLNVIYILYPLFHPHFFVFGTLIILTAIKFRYKILLGNCYQNLLLVSFILYAVFIGGIPFQSKRFLLLSFPIVILFFYPVIKQILEFVKLNRFLVIGIIISVQLFFTFYFGKVFYDRNRLEQKIAFDLKSYSGRTIYIFDMDIALKGRGLDLDYQNIWYKEYEMFSKQALVLVNASQLQKQWIGKNPLINWNKLNQCNTLQVLKSYGNGWNLYLVR